MMVRIVNIRDQEIVKKSLAFYSVLCGYLKKMASKSKTKFLITFITRKAKAQLTGRLRYRSLKRVNQHKIEYMLCLNSLKLNLYPV